MKQGEIWYASFDPTEGSEQAGFKPVLIVSGNLANQYAPVVICCPITSQLKNYYGNPILQPDKQNGLKKPSEVMVIQIRSIAKHWLKKRVGFVPQAVIEICKTTLLEIVSF